MHERRLLYRGLGISVADFRCRARIEPVGPEEPNQSHSIVIVRRGLFRCGHRGEWRVADPNHLLFLNRDELHRYEHPLPGGDDCTIVTLEPAIALEVVNLHAPRLAGSPERPFRGGHAAGTARFVGLHYEALALIRREVAAVRIEDSLAELVEVALTLADISATRAAGKLTPRAARRQRDRAETVKLELNRSVASPPGLAALAAKVGCSAFHLSRLFRREEGVSLREFHRRLRARLAAERLARGARDLTDLALDLGYADHSHFTNSFRREWGVPPSRFRAQVAVSG